MDRTKKLLMSLTASALLAGSGAPNPNLWEGRAAARNSETPRQDPAQTKAEEAIKRLLNGVTEANAMSLDEILAKEPGLDRNTAVKAISELLRSKIRRTGDGTQDKPFRYYDRTGNIG